MILYKLFKTETFKVPKYLQKPEVVYIGTYYECLGKFQGMSPFSLERNNIISYTQYKIAPCHEKEAVVRKDLEGFYELYTCKSKLLFKGIESLDNLVLAAENIGYKVINKEICG
tara:strand:- start:3820 stop:4161 length:342 start_codon:yes stop_codon:yes gene_type:complete